MTERLPTYEDVMNYETRNGSNGSHLDRPSDKQMLESASPMDLPTVEQVICHLKLLEAISKLRREMETDERLSADKGRNGSSLKELRWSIYVSRAVDRFEQWWEQKMIVHGPEYYMKVSEYGKSAAHVMEGGTTSQTRIETISKEEMPPLDILMVWHAYLLNPKSFGEDCLRFGILQSIWKMQFPWKWINEMIDSHTFDYIAPENIKQNFAAIVPWDSMDGTGMKQIECLRCHAQIEVPYSQFAQHEFNTTCQCGTPMTHGSLRVGKFIREWGLYKKHNAALPGTFLESPWVKMQPGYQDSTVYEALKMDKVDNGIRRLLDDKTVEPTVMELRDIFYPYIVKLKQATSTRNQGKFIRRFMSVYWDNSSICSLDLHSAVSRQGVFITKMHQNNWINSPSLTNAVDGMIHKYRNFLKLMRLYPDLLAVPTLDVDLVWHTHQLNAGMYYAYCINAVGRFINHDDKVKETTLSNSFAQTSTLYEKTFTEIYSECMCWYCQAIREINVSWFSSSIKKAHKSFYDKAFTGLYDINHDGQNHISTHNAVPEEEAREKFYSKLHVEYKKAFKRVKKRAKKCGVDINEKHCKHYPWYAPAFIPAFYPSNPVCMATTTFGGHGNCVSGTCNAIAAAGGICGNTSESGVCGTCTGISDCAGFFGSCATSSGGGFAGYDVVGSVNVTGAAVGL